MKFSREQIRNFSNALLRVLNTNNVEDAVGLQKLVDSKVAYPAQDNDYVWCELRPSNAGTTAYTVSYTRPDKGIPLEVKINDALRYSQVILKMDKAVEGYSCFGFDRFGNIQQAKKLPSADLKIVRQELEALGTIVPSKT